MANPVHLPNNVKHYPNPFDFVPFRDAPWLRPETEFDAMGERLSGYLELRIQALTPVHVAGWQENTPDGRQSHHYRQGGRPCIPAATIRGCLRAFIEALTNGWVSQASEKYPNVHGERYRGFKTFEVFSDDRPHTGNPAIPPAYRPQVMPGNALDLASYLFGMVVEEKKEGSEATHADLARKSKVFIEDAFFPPDRLDRDNFWLPDIKGNAIVGGAHPSASNWWYMKPERVSPRTYRGRPPMAEFVGEQYRGRKFYFHQLPLECLPHYLPEVWTYPLDERTQEPLFQKAWLECLLPHSERKTDVFRVYVERVPRRLLQLLVLSLFPGRMHHKLGAGKPFGYGSVAFELTGARLRAGDSLGIPPALEDWAAELEGWKALAWDQSRLQAGDLEALVDRTALRWLARILNTTGSTRLRFFYPPYKGDREGSIHFEKAMTYDRYERILRSRGVSTHAALRDIADALYATKRTIDFRLYQERSIGWDVISHRMP